jgi:hypothetical protein
MQVKGKGGCKYSSVYPEGKRKKVYDIVYDIVRDCIWYLHY